MQQSNLLNNLLNLKSPNVPANQASSRPQWEPASDKQDFQAVMAQTRREAAESAPAAKARKSVPEPAHVKDRQASEESRDSHKARPHHTAEKVQTEKQDAATPAGRPMIADAQNAKPPVSPAEVDTAEEGSIPVDATVEVQSIPVTLEGVLVEADANADSQETGELGLVMEPSILPLPTSQELDVITLDPDMEIAAEEMAASIIPVAATESVVAHPLTEAPLFEMPESEEVIAPLLASGDKPSAPLSAIPVSTTASSLMRSQVPVPELGASIVGDEQLLVDGSVTQTDSTATQTDSSEAQETTASTMTGNIQTLKQALQKPIDNLLPMQEKMVATETAKPAAPTAPVLTDAFARPQEQPLAATRSFMAQIQLPQTLGQPQWNQAVGERVLWMAAQNLTAADIRLDPPDLGTMHVKVTVQQDQASVTFVSQHQVVREALDQQATRLREMFAEQGLNLVHVDVSDRHAHEHKSTGDEQSGGQKGKQSEEEELQVIGQTYPLNLRLVDHYA